MCSVYPSFASYFEAKKITIWKVQSCLYLNQTPINRNPAWLITILHLTKTHFYKLRLNLSFAETLFALCVIVASSIMQKLFFWVFGCCLYLDIVNIRRLTFFWTQFLLIVRASHNVTSGASHLHLISNVCCVKSSCKKQTTTCEKRAIKCFVIMSSFIPL